MPVNGSQWPEHFDVAVIGAGPAGLAAALAAAYQGARVLLVEREDTPGGILKQCIHDGFGLLVFGQRFSGPEYAQRFIDQLPQSGIDLRLSHFVSRAEKTATGFSLQLVSQGGIARVSAKSLVLATGCRERTAKQIGIHGTRPAGVLSAGTAQHYVNLLGQLPARRCVILGSGDVGLIMARRLTLEGAEVLGVYEAKPTASGLTRNLVQCLDDFGIPLHLSHTVTRLFGHQRLSAVEVAQVDEVMRPIAGSEQIIECDGLILSVGLIPENELAENLSVPLDAATAGPICDQHGQTMVDGIFSCGNAWHVHDLVDYVSEGAERAGIAAAHHALRPTGKPAAQPTRQLIPVQAGPAFQYAAPQMLDVSATEQETVLYFRAAAERGATRVSLYADEQLILEKQYPRLRPPEMERLRIPPATLPPATQAVTLEMEAI